MWIGGVQVTRGYLRRPELTAERFIMKAWTETGPHGSSLYRTGDRVRWYADGELEFGGRIDFQVKLRGQRLELGEIEHALRAQPRVVDAVVLLDKGLDALVAYVSPAVAVVGGGGGAESDGASAGADTAAFESGMPFGRAAGLSGARDALPAYICLLYTSPSPRD